jgi:hypothetical protein
MSIDIEKTRMAIQDYFKKKENWEKLLKTSSGKELKDALTEYEHAEAVLRYHGGTVEICYKCRGNKGFWSLSHYTPNGHWVPCSICDGKGELPYGAKDWGYRKEEQRLNFLEEVKTIAYEKLAEWEKKNPPPKFN